MGICKDCGLRKVPLTGGRCGTCYANYRNPPRGGPLIPHNAKLAEDVVQALRAEYRERLRTGATGNNRWYIELAEQYGYATKKPIIKMLKGTTYKWVKDE
jgi:hypothetical protein